MRRMLFLATALLGLVGCSVKSDRTWCPCIVDLTMSETSEELVDVLAWADTLVHSDNVRVPQGGCVHEFEAPRRRMTVCAFSGLHCCSLEGRSVISPPGTQMDELYVWTSELVPEGETVSAEVHQHKQFAHIHLTMIFPDDSHQQERVRFVGNVAGVDLTTLNPVKGDFLVESYPVYGTYYRVSVPRQTDDSLELVFPDTGRTLPLGRHIASSGFDWTKTDLDDVNIILLYDVEMKITIEVMPWNDTDNEDVII